jgi:hypothetical protein
MQLIALPAPTVPLLSLSVVAAAAAASKDAFLSFQKGIENAHLEPLNMRTGENRRGGAVSLDNPKKKNLAATF